MSRILLIARREFLSTAMTKGFIFGAFILPLIFMAVIPVVIALTMMAKAPMVVGDMIVIDHSGMVAGDLQQRLDDAIARERESIAEISAKAQQLLGSAGGSQQAAAEAAIEQVLPGLEIVVRPAGTDTDLDDAKAPLTIKASKDDPTKLLAVVVIDETAVLKPDSDEAYGGFQLFVRPGLDERTLGFMRSALRSGIRAQRFDRHEYDETEVRALTRINEHETLEVTEEGEQSSREDLRQFLPMVFMILMMMSVMIGSGYLLTTTVEEKSSRVVEVLLSATSPMQIMTGKILGQMGVGLTMLTIYTGLGIGVLIKLALSDVIEPMHLVYMLIFFVAAYFMMASLLAAVGSAVNDMREAQALQAPVMMIVIVPYILWAPISRDPNSMLATVLSFVPPISPFVMMMRIVSTDPPASWQIVVSIVVMAIGAYVCVWFAAKVFRVGLLMYGKPPNLRTLIRWVRMA